MSLTKAWDLFSKSCTCGVQLENNCAHYLSNALVLAGYSQLDGGTGANMRNHKVGSITMCVCSHGRPMRAKEMRLWFQSKFTETTTRETVLGLFYQQNGNQGHVGLVSGSGSSKGTANGLISGWDTWYYYP